MTDLFPTGLSKKEFDILLKCSKDYSDVSMRELVDKARDYIETVRIAYEKNSIANIRLANAINNSIIGLYTGWDNVPEYAKSWCRAMVLYFVLSDDDEDDLNSPIGFDDDAEVMNACLRLANREDLCVNPEEYDEL